MSRIRVSRPTLLVIAIVVMGGLGTVVIRVGQERGWGRAPRVSIAEYGGDPLLNVSIAPSAPRSGAPSRSGVGASHDQGVQGRVLSEDGAPVAGALVRCIPAGAVWCDVSDCGSCESDHSGEFVVAPPTRATTCDLVAVHPDHGRAVKADVDLNAPGGEVVIQFGPGFPLTCVVRTPGGSPIPGAALIVRGRYANGPECLSSTKQSGVQVEIHRATTDSRGSATVIVSTSQDYIVDCVTPWLSGGPHPRGRDRVIGKPGEALSLVLVPCGALLAKAVDAETGEAVRTARWRVMSGMDSARYGSPGGRFRIGPNWVLPAGRSHLSKFVLTESWPVDFPPHEVLVTAPGYKPTSASVRVQGEGDAGTLEPQLVRLPRDSSAKTSTIHVISVGSDGRIGIGPYRGTILLRSGQSPDIYVDLAVDSQGKGTLGDIPLGTFEVRGNDFHSSEQIAAGAEATWRLRPNYGVVRVDPVFSEVGAPPGGFGIRLVPGFVDRSLSPRARIPFGEKALISPIFDYSPGDGPVGTKYEAWIAPGEWTLELLRPGYLPVRSPVRIRAGEAVELAPVLVESDDAVWPPWRDEDG